MPRSYIDVQAAKDALFNKKTESAIYQLPPGYIAGFQLEVTESNQLIVGKGICNIRGKRVENNSIHIVSGENFVDPDHILTVFTYYIYISSDGQFKVDVLEAEYDSDGYGFYHPVLKNYRYLGRFQIHTDGTYYNIFQQNPIVKGGISSAAIEALFLYALEAAIIGYKGTGINDSPSEGDRRTYIDNDEIGFQEYTGGEWVDRAKIGGAIAGLFLAWVGACGLYHPDNPPGATEYFPNEEYHIYQLEGTYADTDGVDDWLSHFDCAFSAVQVKFGTQSLFATDGDVGFLIKTIGGTISNSQSMGGWWYFESVGVGIRTSIVVWLNEANNLIVLAIEDGNLVLSVKKGGITILNEVTVAENVPLKEWHYIAYSYDSDNDNLHIVLDSHVYHYLSLGGAWGAGTMQLILGTANASFDRTHYLDEICVASNQYIPPEVWVQHYNHNVAWNTTDKYAWADIPIRPYPGGRCYLDADTLITGNLTVDGNIIGDATITGQLAITGVSRCRAYQSTSQSIATLSTTKVNLQTETYDNLGEFTSSRFTATQAGYYLINGNAGLDTPVANTYFNTYIYKNGGVVAQTSQQTSTTNNQVNSVSTIQYLAVGDNIELYVRHNCGVNELMIATSSTTFLEVHRLS